MQSPVAADPANASFTKRGAVEPLVLPPSVSHHDRRSGARARRRRDRHRVERPQRHYVWATGWVSIGHLYGSGRLAIVPMDFYFPGTGERRPASAQGLRRHINPRLLELMQKLRDDDPCRCVCTRRYLDLKSSASLTDVVRDHKRYLPLTFRWSPLAAQSDVDEEEPLVRRRRAARPESARRLLLS